MKEWTCKLKIVTVEFKQATLKGLKWSMKGGNKQINVRYTFASMQINYLKKILACYNSAEIFKIYLYVSLTSG